MKWHKQHDCAERRLFFFVRQMRIVDKFLTFRREQKAILDANEEEYTLGDVTTVNLTMLSGGVRNQIRHTFKE